MRRIAILCVLLLLVVEVSGKTIHWLTFIDTTTPNVADYDVNTHNLLYGRWINLVNAVLSNEGYAIDVKDVYGSQTNPENCKRIVEGLQCGSEDIVVFYYVGHGTENTQTSVFPQMCMAQQDYTRFIPLSWVHETLKGKGARLTITIGMCCNVRQGAPGKSAPTFSANYGNAYVDTDMMACIKKMFLGYKGDLIATSSTPGESSYPCIIPELGKTDWFTYALLSEFNIAMPTKTNPTWETLLTAIRDDVYNNVRNTYGASQTQTPLWQSNIVSATATTTTATTPAPTVTPKKEQTDDIVELTTILNGYFAAISSSNNAAKDRIAAAQKLQGVFTENLLVRIMSQDGEVVVDREDIDTFLGRIATSSILLNVSVVDCSYNNDGLIDSLRVKEVYKKSK